MLPACMLCWRAGVLLQELVPHVLSGAAYLDIHTSGEGALLRWYGTAPGPNGTYSTEHVESQVMQLLSVLAQSLFRQQPSTMAAFGAAFWAPFVAQYQAAFLHQIQGSSVAVLQARQEAASSMEQQAVSMGLAEPGELGATCIHACGAGTGVLSTCCCSTLLCLAGLVAGVLSDRCWQ